MATEFYKSIPQEIRGKLREYVEKYSPKEPLESKISMIYLFYWGETPEGHDFWSKHNRNKTFPIWSEELNRFIDPPQGKISKSMGVDTKPSHKLEYKGYWVMVDGQCPSEIVEEIKSKLV